MAAAARRRARHFDGREVLQKIKLANSSAKVILTSGYTREEAQRSFQLDGVSLYLEKPIHMKVLNECLHEVLLG